MLFLLNTSFCSPGHHQQHPEKQVAFYWDNRCTWNCSGTSQLSEGEIDALRPRDHVCLASQSAPRKAQSRKKPTNLCTPREFIKKTCPPCLIIIQSCYFDYSINKPFACSRCLICVSSSGHVISTYYVRKGSWAFLSSLPTNQRGRKIRSYGLWYQCCEVYMIKIILVNCRQRIEVKEIFAVVTCFQRGFIALSVEHRTAIAEVMGSNPVVASEFVLGFICNCLSYFTTAKISFTSMPML